MSLLWIDDPGVGTYFRLGAQVQVPTWISDPNVGPYFQLETQVWVHTFKGVGVGTLLKMGCFRTAI